MVLASPEPVIVTLVPGPPLAGVKPVMPLEGTVRLAEEVPVPSEFVTLTGPVVAATGRVAASWVSLDTESEDASAPLKRTAVVPVKPVPVTKIVEPGNAEVGVNAVTVGAALGWTVKKPGELPVPEGVLT